MLSYSVADLLRAAPGSSEEVDIDVPDLPLADGLVLSRPLVGHVRLTSSGRGILVQGRLTTALAERCSRCLRPAETPLSLELDDEALPSVEVESGRPLDRSQEPDSLRLDDHHELDLEPTLRDAISLAEPIAPLCRWDCPGLCPSCGADLAADPDHAHPADEVDTRLAVMAGLVDRLTEPTRHLPDTMKEQR